MHSVQAKPETTSIRGIATKQFSFIISELDPTPVPYQQTKGSNTREYRFDRVHKERIHLHGEIPRPVSDADVDRAKVK